MKIITSKQYLNLTKQSQQAGVGVGMQSSSAASTVNNAPQNNKQTVMINNDQQIQAIMQMQQNINMLLTDLKQKVHPSITAVEQSLMQMQTMLNNVASNMKNV